MAACAGPLPAGGGAAAPQRQGGRWSPVETVEAATR
eukprot:gene4824-54894_t